MPTLRATSADTQGSTASRNVPFPSGSQAGDRAFLMYLHNYGSGTPSGWEDIWAPVESGNVFLTLRTKVLDSTDISLGYVTINSVGSSVSGWIISVFVGDVYWRVPFARSVSSGGNNSDTNLAASPNILDGDYCLLWGMSRTWNDDTFTAPAGATQLEFHPDSDGMSSCLYEYEAVADGPFTATHHMLWGTSNFQVILPILDDEPEQWGHRYWRVVAMGYSSNVALISQMFMRETTGGSDVAAGNTVTTTGTWTTASNIFDGSTSSFGYCTPTRASPCSVGIDFGSDPANWREIMEITLRNRASGNSGELAQGVTNFLVQSSDDASAWTDEWWTVDSDWVSANTVRTYTKPSSPVVTLDISSPPTDGSSLATALTAAGNATVTSGRFVFDGTGDYYYNSNPSGKVCRVPWKFTIELFDVLATNSGFNGMVTLGTGAGNRFLITESDGTLSVWEGGTAIMSVGSIIDNTTPTDVKVIIDGNDAYLYANDVEIDTGTFTLTNNTIGLYLGADTADLSVRSMNGGFSGVKITHDALLPEPPDPTGRRRGFMLVAN